jgi:hypothetical protein
VPKKSVRGMQDLAKPAKPQYFLLQPGFGIFRRICHWHKVDFWGVSQVSSGTSVKFVFTLSASGYNFHNFRRPSALFTWTNGFDDNSARKDIRESSDFLGFVIVAALQVSQASYAIVSVSQDF